MKTEESSVLEKLKTMLSASACTSPSVAKMSKHSKLADLPGNLVDEDEVEADKIKVGPNRFIRRSMLEEIEKNNHYFTARVETLVDLFYKGEKHLYSVKKSSSHVVEEEEISSMLKILMHMKWNKTETLDETKVRNRVIKYLSACRIAQRANSKKKTLGAAENENPEKKKVDSESSSDSSSDSDSSDSDSSDSN